jgi:PAS domain-containing protein
MKPGRRLYSAISFGGLVLMLAFVGIYALIQYKSYQDHSLRILSGLDRTVIMGQLIEARIKGLQELVTFSVSSQSSSDEFNLKLKNIISDVTILAKDRPDGSADKIKRELENLSDNQSKTTLEDLFVHYRNVKASASNLYRTGWENKYMTVVRIVGQIIQDIDNIAYHDAEQAIVAVQARLTQLLNVVTRSTLAQGDKIQLFSQINQLRAVLSRYMDVSSQSRKIRDLRHESLKRALVNIQEFNNQQNKAFAGFTAMAHNKFSLTTVVVLICLSLSLLWAVLWRNKILSYSATFVADIQSQIAGWFGLDGELRGQMLSPGKNVDLEYESIYAALNSMYRKVLDIRYQDACLKKNIVTPIVMINKSRQAVYWNHSAQSLLGQNKSSESGSTHYLSLIKYALVNGKVVVDPIEKCFIEGTEQAKNYELVVDNSNLTVRIVCVPVFAVKGDVEYVLVHIRDLREEFKLIDNELNKQLGYLRAATQALKAGQTPEEAPVEARALVRDTVQDLRKYSFDQQHSKELLVGQIKAAFDRLAREGGLKRNVHNRLHQVSDELTQCCMHVKYIEEMISRMNQIVQEAAQRDATIKAEYAIIRRKGSDLQRNIRQEQDLAGRCISSLKQIDSLTKGIRSRERLIFSALEKATIANANNSILRSRPDVSIVEITAILDSVNVLAEQFDRAYRFIQQAVDELELQYRSLKSGLEESLATSNQLSQDDRGLIDALVHLEKLSDLSKDDFNRILKTYNALKGHFAKLSQTLSVLEDRSHKLEKIGGASLELQAHMESGVKGILEGTA